MNICLKDKKDVPAGRKLNLILDDICTKTMNSDSVRVKHAVHKPLQLKVLSKDTA